MNFEAMQKLNESHRIFSDFWKISSYNNWKIILLIEIVALSPQYAYRSIQFLKGFWLVEA